MVDVDVDVDDDAVSTSFGPAFVAGWGRRHLFRQTGESVCFRTAPILPGGLGGPPQPPEASHTPKISSNPFLSFFSPCSALYVFFCDIAMTLNYF
jgi:hypothetical protein